MKKYLMLLFIGLGLFLISCNNPDTTSNTSNSVEKSTTVTPSSTKGTNNSFGTEITGDITTNFPWED